MTDESKLHPAIPKLCDEVRGGRLDRREFLRTATLLGLSAGAAYAVAGLPPLAAPARAADPAPSGTLRIAMHVQEIQDPHTISWVEASNIVRPICEYLSRTDQDNVTRPYLLESWTPSEDLKTWTFVVREGVTWHSGRPFTADDAIWNIQRVLDPAVGSSVLGLMKSYLLEEYETGATKDDGTPVKSTRLWSETAIEKVDDRTFRLNLKVAQLAVPEHFFHYPFFMLDPEENGAFGIGSNGTGPFKLVEYEVAGHAVLEAVPTYWGEGPHLARVEIYDMGDDPSAPLSALRSGQVDSVYEVDSALLDSYGEVADVTVYQSITSQTGVARMRVTEKPFDDPRVRKAFRLASDPKQVLDIVFGPNGAIAEHHHVCEIHPEYAKLPPFPRDVEQAKALLAEAGYPDGVTVEIATKNSPPWESRVAQVLADQWRAAGITCKINTMPAAAYWDIWTQVPFGFTTWGHRPLGVMNLALAYRTGVPWNESAYSNPEFDALLTQAEGTYDVEARRAIMAKLEAILQEDGPIVQPIWRSCQSAHNNRVKGFRQHPTQYVFFEQLSIEA